MSFSWHRSWGLCFALLCRHLQASVLQMAMVELVTIHAHGFDFTNGNATAGVSQQHSLIVTNCSQIPHVHHCSWGGEQNAVKNLALQCCLRFCCKTCYICDEEDMKAESGCQCVKTGLSVSGQ